MSCCGQGRMALKTSQAATATAPARTWPGVQARAIPPPRAGVPLRYLGAAPIVVHGPVTGMAYSFAGGRHTQPVDARDLPGLLKKGIFRGGG